MCPTSNKLSSWKEIASYLGRSVRTVQRWERELGLPIRRIESGRRPIIITSTAEVEDWVQKNSAAMTTARGPSLDQHPFVTPLASDSSTSGGQESYSAETDLARLYVDIFE